MQLLAVDRSRLSIALAVIFLLLSTPSVLALTASVSGAVAGQHSVGNDGSAQYTIPLNAPGGIQGMRPDVALTYSSNGGNSVAGVGFDIGGVSRIHRCGTTIERDGYVDGVDFDGNDQYCLDGQRLIAVDGDYGADATEYRTENDSIARIISHGSEGVLVDISSGGATESNEANNPQSFTVWTSDGRIYEYGDTENSRSSFLKNFQVCPEGSVVYVVGSVKICFNFDTELQVPILTVQETRTYEWSVNQVSDRYGNRMVYTYEGGASEKRINRIDYNFVQNTARNSIQFLYEGRLDISNGFFAGAPIIQTKRLQKIAAYSGSKELRALIVEYGNNTATTDSVVSKIWECAGGSSSTCTNPTEFTWEDGVVGFAATANNSGNSAAGWDNNPLAMDVNGDGRTDLVQADGGQWRIMLSNGEKYASQVASVSNTGWEDAKVIRYNNDSHDDILLAKGGTWHVLLGGATDEQMVTITIGGQNYTLTIPSSPVFTEVDTGIAAGAHTVDNSQLIDVNGDGLKDIIYSSGTGWFSGIRVRLLEYDDQTGQTAFGEESYTGISQTEIDLSRAIVADFNGDGREDVFAPDRNTTNAQWSTYYSTQGTAFNKSVLGGTNSTYDNLKVLDFNGDGLPDILVKSSSNSISVRMNTGSGFESADAVLSSYTIGTTEWNKALTYDYNGDGRDDLLLRIGSYWYALVSNGVDFSATFTGITNAGWNRNPIVSDMTGNGMPDLTLNISNTWQTRPHNSARPDYLTKITNGMGVETEFHYRFLTDPSDPDFYERGGDVEYPLVNVQNASYLVSEVRQSNGWFGTDMNSTSYRYKKLLIHQLGLGNLGFEQIINKNNDTGIETVSTFDLSSASIANHQYGTLLQVTTTADNGTVLSDTTNTWQVDMWCGAGKGIACSNSDDSSRRYLVSPIETTVVKRDLNGAFLHEEVSTNPSMTAIYYGTNGTDRTMTSVVKDEAGSVLRTKTTIMRYDNNVTDWLMGMVRYSEVESDTGDGSPITRRSELDYAAAGASPTGRKTEERIVNPDNGDVLHRTRYGIDASGGVAVDSYGRNLAVTVSGPDFEPRTTSVVYDASQRYIASEINALSHEVSHTYYEDSSVNAGLRKETTDPNGLRSRFTYDSFGRPLTTTAFYGTTKPVLTTTSYHDCAQASDRCTTYTGGYARYYVKTVGADGSETRSYFNKLGKIVRKATRGFDENNEQWVFEDTVYNQRGNPMVVSEPYYEGSGTAPWNYVYYDDLDRPYRTKNAEGRYDYVEYNGLIVNSIRDSIGKNQIKTEERDSLGNLIKVTDTDGQELVYTYNALGQMLSTQPPGVTGLLVVPTTVTYDVLGRKIAMSDPDKGDWSYTYNGLGELITQTNARGEASCMAYDKLGRMVKRVDGYGGNIVTTTGQPSEATTGCSGDSGNVNTATWTYDAASGAGTGRLHQISGAYGYQKTLTYNTYGSTTQVVETISGSSYTTQSTYDSLHRLDVVTYPAVNSSPGNLLQVRSDYNNRGYLESLTNVQSSEVYYRAETMDARGNVTAETYANGLRTQRAYQRETGYLQTIATGTALTPLSHQDLAFDFDVIGNLETRVDAVTGFSETFDYDNLNRLTHTYADFGNGDVQETAVAYDALGNIISKTGVGVYQYGSQCGGSAGPHAVCSISAGSVGTKNAVYSYDPNGNMLSGDGRSITWSLFDKPTQISQNGNTTLMGYGPERQLITRQDTTTAGTTSTVFVGGLYENVTDQNGNTKERHYVGGHTIVTYSNRTASSAGTIETRYLHKDHIGSVVLITDENGVEVESFSFDPWGKRRAPSLADLEAAQGNWNSLDAFQKGNLTLSALSLGSDITNKGFTGHEQMDGVNLIHMGGRVYDAEIGRFLSADPFVQDSANIQALNRYSYVQNNPLSYTDPSGYFLSGLKSFVSKAWKAVKNAHSAVFEFERKLRRKVLRKIGESQILSTAISIGLTVFVPGCQSGACSMVFNAAMADANGGTIAQILKGAAVGMATAGIPGVDGALGQGLTGGLGTAINSRVAAAMLVGGAMAKAQGGKFIDGVKGAAIGIAAGGIATGLRNAYNAGVNSLGAALNHVKWAFEDMTLPSAEARRGIVTIDDIHPDGSVYGSTGPIETMASTPTPTRYVTMPWFAEKSTDTGSLFASGAGNPRDGASSQATRVLSVTAGVVISGPRLVQAGIIIGPHLHHFVREGLSAFNTWRQADKLVDILEGIDGALPQRIDPKDFSQPASPPAIYRLKDW